MLNKTYYAEVLCENKDNPKKPGCNGKCHLKKQLEQQKPVEEQHPFNKSAQISFYPELIAVLLSQVKLHKQENFNDSKKVSFNFQLYHHILPIFFILQSHSLIDESYRFG